MRTHNGFIALAIFGAACCGGATEVAAGTLASVSQAAQAEQRVVLTVEGMT